MGVGRGSDAGLEQRVVFLYGGEHVYEEGDELQVALGVLARSEQLRARVGTQGPVVVLTAAVYAGKRFFMQKTNKPVLCRDLLHYFHCDLVVVGSNVSCGKNGR